MPARCVIHRSHDLHRGLDPIAIDHDNEGVSSVWCARRQRADDAASTDQTPGTTGREIATTMGSEGCDRWRARMSAPVALMLCVVPVRHCCSFPMRYDTGRRGRTAVPVSGRRMSSTVAHVNKWAVRMPRVEGTNSASTRATDRPIEHGYRVVVTRLVDGWTALAQAAPGLQPAPRRGTRRRRGRLQRPSGALATSETRPCLVATSASSRRLDAPTLLKILVR